MCVCRGLDNSISLINISLRSLGIRLALASDVSSVCFCSAPCPGGGRKKWLSRELSLISLWPQWIYCLQNTGAGESPAKRLFSGEALARVSRLDCLGLRCELK